MTLPNKEQLLAAISKTDKLVPAPRTLGRALQLLRNPESGLQDIAELISRDSALAVDVLRCANSAFYSRQSRVVSIGDAVQVIGFGETIRLVSLVAVHQTTHRNLGSYGIAAEDFWSESLFSGLFLEALSKHVQAVNGGEAYTAGLLRFVGRLAIDQAMQALGGCLFWDGRSSLSQWERENVGLTQAEVGGQLMRKWELPEQMVLAIEGQELAELPEGSPALAECMHFAAEVLPAGSSLASIDALMGGTVLDLRHHPFAEAHQLTSDAVAELLRETYLSFVSIRQTLTA